LRHESENKTREEFQVLLIESWGEERGITDRERTEETLRRWKCPTLRCEPSNFLHIFKNLWFCTQDLYILLNILHTTIYKKNLRDLLAPNVSSVKFA
jgi:hypothetical protein